MNKKDQLILSKDCGKLIKTYRGQSATIRSIHVDVKSNRFTSASDDKKIKIWDYETGKCLKTINEPQSLVSSLFIQNDKLITASECKTVKIWDLNTYNCLNTLKNESKVTSLSLISDNLIACSCYGGILNIWNLNTLTKVKSFNDYNCYCFLNAKLVYKSKIIGIPSDSYYNIVIWDSETFERIRELEGHLDTIFDLNITLNGNLLSCSEDQTIKLWHIETGELLKSIEFQHPVNCVRVLNEDLIALGLGNYETGYIIIYNLTKMEIVKQTRSFLIYVFDLTLLPNGNLLSGSGNGFINEWKIFE
jgi:WD40 repeat protein